MMDILFWLLLLEEVLYCCCCVVSLPQFGRGASLSARLTAIVSCLVSVGTVSCTTMGQRLAKTKNRRKEKRVHRTVEIAS